MPSQRAPQLRGYTILVASVLLNAVAIHCRKAAQQTCSPATTVVGFCLSGLLCFLISGWICRRFRWQAADLHSVTIARIYRVTRRMGIWALIGTLAGAASGWVVGTAFRDYDVDLVAFLANMTIVFLILAGLLSGDRISPREIIAMIIITLGAFAFSYRGGAFEWRALVIVTISCILDAVKNISVKVATTGGDLPCFMSGALALIIIWLLIGSALVGELEMPDLRAAVFMFLNGFLGSFLGMALLYTSFHIIGVARSAAVNTLRPMAVLLLGIVLLHIPLPTLLQILGGTMILSGSAALAFSSAHRRSKPVPRTD